MKGHVAIARVDHQTVGVAHDHFAIHIDGTATGAECLGRAALEKHLAAHHDRLAAQVGHLARFAKGQCTAGGGDAAALHVHNAVTTGVGICPQLAAHGGIGGRDAGVGAQPNVPPRLDRQGGRRARVVGHRPAQQHIGAGGFEGDGTCGGQALLYVDLPTVDRHRTSD